MLVTLLLSAPTRAQTVRSGLGVFGNGFGIHGTDTLTVWGDLVLEGTEVVGEGTLKLRGHRSAQLVAHRSTVQKLHVANPTRVTLHGDLRVTQRLTVEEGSLDTRPGALILPNTCTVVISKADKLLVHTNVLIAFAQPRQLQQGPQQLDADSAPVMIWPGRRRDIKCTLIVLTKEVLRTEQYTEQPTPPPEGQPV